MLFTWSAPNCGRLRRRFWQFPWRLRQVLGDGQSSWRILPRARPMSTPAHVKLSFVRALLFCSGSFQVSWCCSSPSSGVSLWLGIRGEITWPHALQINIHRATHGPINIVEQMCVIDNHVTHRRPAQKVAITCGSKWPVCINRPRLDRVSTLQHCTPDGRTLRWTLLIS